MLIALTAFAFIGTLGMWIFTNWSLKLGFEEIEVEFTEETVLWGVDELYDLAVIMDSVVTPLAAWDDLYEYLEHRDQGFVDDLFSDSVLERNEFNLVIIYSKSGEIIYWKYYDYLSNKTMELPPLFREESSISALQDYSPETGSTIGVVMNRNQPIILSSRPITDTSEIAPSRGTLVIGFDFTKQDIALVQEYTGLPIEYYPLDSGYIPSGIKSNISPEKPFQYTISKDTIIGYYLIEDLFHDPALIVRLSQPRTIYQTGQDVRREFLSVIMGLGVLLVIFVIVYVDRTILVKVVKLSDDVTAIAEMDDLSARVEESESSDELGVLTRRVNEMLQRLQDSRDIEQKQQKEMDKLREESTKEIFEAAKKVSYLVNTELERPLRSMKQVAYHLREEDNVALAEILENSIKHSEKTLIELASLSNLGEPNRTITDLNEVIEAAITNVSPKVGVNIVFDPNEDFLAINLDAIKMARALENLVRNSVEAIESSGTVNITVGKEKKVATISLSDDGIGIPEDEMDMLFEPFYTTKDNAMGLGLIYAKQVIEAHKGDITVESTLGNGTTVNITLPLIEEK